MKALHSVSIIMAALALLAFSVPVYAANRDNRIEESARQSYVFKTYLQADDIKIQSKNGAVTLTGIVNINGVRSVKNRMIIE